MKKYIPTYQLNNKSALQIQDNGIIIADSTGTNYKHYYSSCWGLNSSADTVCDNIINTFCL